MELVDEEMVKTGATNEQLFKVNAAHNELSLVPVDGPLYDRLVHFFRAFAEVAPHNVALAFRHLEVEDAPDVKPRASLDSFPGVHSGNETTQKSFMNHWFANLTTFRS